MQPTPTVSNRRALPQIPVQGMSNKSIPITGPVDLNCRNTRNPRLPSTFLNRTISRSSPSPNLNTKRATPLSHLSSLYSHSNHSGDLLSQSRSPAVLVRSSTLTIPIRLDNLLKRRWPSISLLRSRRKLWKKYWLVINLPTVPESGELIHEVDSVQRLRPRSEKPVYRKPPPSQLRSTLEVRPCPLRAVITLPPPPELDDDTGSESSGSDEDLDAYQFDLSNCTPSRLGKPDDELGQVATEIYDKPMATVSYSCLRDFWLCLTFAKQHPAVRVSDISSIYESITRRTLARISSL